MTIRIVAFVDHEIGFRLLDKMIFLSVNKKIELVAVVTTMENGQMWWPGVDKVCQEFGVPLIRYQEPFNKILAIEDIDWYLLMSWKHVIKEDLINKPRKGVVNLHYSLLPKYRGVYPVNWALIEGEKITGVTYHLVNKKIDDGDIILQSEAPIFMNDTVRSLQIRLDDLAFQLFDNLLYYLNNFESMGVVMQKPDLKKSYKSRADFNAICEIDLNKCYKGIELLNLLRGLSYFPETKNAFFVDPESGEKIYLNLNISKER